MYTLRPPTGVGSAGGGCEGVAGRLHISVTPPTGGGGDGGGWFGAGPLHISVTPPTDGWGDGGGIGRGAGRLHCLHGSREGCRDTRKVSHCEHRQGRPAQVSSLLRVVPCYLITSTF